MVTGGERWGERWDEMKGGVITLVVLEGVSCTNADSIHMVLPASS